jgi:cytochrome c-type biogenesis protein CcsB
MISSKFVTAVTFLYLFCTVIYFNYLAFRSKKLGSLAVISTWVALTLHTIAILARWIESYRLGFGHAPLSNMYESLVFFSWCITFIYLLWEVKLKTRIVGAFAMPFAFLTVAYAALSPGVSDRIDPLIPALQSNWLHAHVITCFLSYASFAVSCGVSVMYLLKARREKPGRPEGGMLSLFPTLESLDTLIYKTIAVGFPLLTIGIITGSAWANYAWGAYWSWDPKETWSLITWIVYAVMLHARSVRGWRGRRMAWLALAGFACVLFTYLGVNFLDSLHSYF